MITVPIVNAQLSGLISSSAGAYAVIKKVNNDIQWWAVILAGAVLMACFRTLSWLRPSMMIPAMQRALACLIYLVVAFCIMLIMIQFRDFWIPVVTFSIDYIVEAF